MALKTTDPQAILDAANNYISAYMNGDIMDTCKQIIADSVEPYVYDLYDQTDVDHPYKRRQAAGGLADKREYYSDEDANPFGNDHEIRIRDNRREVGVVSSGSGYTWTRSKMYRKPFPRPYFPKADEAIQRVLDSMIMAALSGV